MNIIHTVAVRPRPPQRADHRKFHCAGLISVGGMHAHAACR